MYMYDILLQYKELEKILKQENGEGDTDNPYENKINEYQSNMKTQMDSYKSQMSSTMPSISGNTPSLSNLTSGFKMPKF